MNQQKETEKIRTKTTNNNKQQTTNNNKKIARLFISIREGGRKNERNTWGKRQIKKNTKEYSQKTRTFNLPQK